MDVNDLVQQKRREIRAQSEKRAAGEVALLLQKYESKEYGFEHGNQPFHGILEDARLAPPPENGYEIHLLVSKEIAIDGQCTILDSRGRRVGAGARTVKLSQANRVVLKTLALP